MRADLKSLKHRLDAELHELGKFCRSMCLGGWLKTCITNQQLSFAITGIDDEAAEKILSKFYLGGDAQGSTGEASPLKVRRTNQ